MKLKGYGKLTFYTQKEFHKKYPKGAGGYTVIGAVGQGVGKGQAAETILAGEELVEYYPYREPGFWKENQGYLEVGDKAYVYIAVQRSRAWKILLILALLFVAGAAAVYGMTRTPDGVQLDPNSGKYQAPLELPEEANPNRISLPGYSKIYMIHEEDTSDVALWNPETNPCYFVYTIRLKETEEVIYESGLIAPGDAVSGIQFNRTFTKGVYPIMVSISTYDLLNPEQQLNGGELASELVVQYKEGQVQD